MARGHIVKFALLSAAVHVAVLAPWPAPIMPKYRAAVTLSIGFAAHTPRAAPAATKSASTPAAQKTAQQNSKAKWPKLKHSHTQKSANKPVPRAPSREARRPQSRSASISKAKLKSSLARKTITKLTPPTPAYLGRRSAVLAAKLSQPEQRSIKVRKTTIAGTPTVARPWQPVWGSVRYYEQPKQAMAALAKQPLESPASTETIATREPARRVGLSDASTASPDPASEKTRAFIRGRLETDLSQYFWYPAIARQRGWQGNVRVEFTVQPDGRLTNIHVTHSSGYAVLDESALKALREVGYLEQVPAWLNDRAMEIELPVIYKLEEKRDGPSVIQNLYAHR